MADSKVMTVLGTISPESLGITLPHEHLFSDIRFIKPKKEWTREKVTLNNLYKLKIDYISLSDNLILDSMSTSIKEVKRYRDLGGSTIVDVGSIGLGRKPLTLKKVSQKTGVNIIMGTGFYIKGGLSSSIINSSDTQLAKSIIQECQRGYKETGIRPGIIGEVGVGPVIEEWDKRSLKLACLVQKETGLPITVHIQAVPVVEGFDTPNGLEVVSLLEKCGADLSRTVIGHVDAQINLKYLKDLLATGVYIEFDHFGKEFYIAERNFFMSRDIERIEAIKELVDSKFTNQILISSDICLKQDLTSYGGHGYAHILQSVVPIMKANGFTDDTINKIVKDNPKRLLATKSTF
ncbi:MAG: hypothetical protein GX149_01270, partial [Acholeplasmataceae bacterium]|nr:hypothetical protein [Acholeplasmataceae bacterium]